MPSIKHPNHIIPDDVALCMRKLNEGKKAEQARQEKIAKLARPTREERSRLTQVREEAARSRGVTADMVPIHRDISNRTIRRITDTTYRDAVIEKYYDRHPWDLSLAEPEPTDPTFWWARTDAFHSNRSPREPDEGSAAHFSAGFDNDGLKFTGGVSTHDGDDYYDSFGAVALFGLAAERIPQSLSRRWISAPHVELFGGLLGHTGDDDITTGDLWSKCWMYREQQLFQLGFGPDGPVPIIVGQANEREKLIDEEDNDRSVHVGLRGFQWMPPVAITNINTANTLFARLEIRFDTLTEGAGSHLWIDPQVLIRTFQWPLASL